MEVIIAGKWFKNDDGLLSLLSVEYLFCARKQVKVLYIHEFINYQDSPITYILLLSPV